MTVRARWTAWCSAPDCKARIGQEKSISDAIGFALGSGWSKKGDHMFCSEHQSKAAAWGERRSSPKTDGLVALVSQRPGLRARELTQILSGTRDVSAVRVGQVGSLLRAAMLRGLVVRRERGRWYHVSAARLVIGEAGGGVVEDVAADGAEDDGVTRDGVDGDGVADGAEDDGAADGTDDGDGAADGGTRRTEQEIRAEVEQRAREAFEERMPSVIRSFEVRPHDIECGAWDDCDDGENPAIDRAVEDVLSGISEASSVQDVGEVGRGEG